MHRTLERQIRRFLGEAAATTLPQNLRDLLEAVSETYRHSDEDRLLIERSLELSSKELSGINTSLLQEKKVAQEERDRAQAIVSSMGEGLIVVNKNCEIVLINHSAKELLELNNEEEVVGKPVQGVYQVISKGKEMAEENRPLARTIATAQVLRLGVEDDLKFRRKSGSSFWASMVATPLMHDGNADGAIMVFRDVTNEYQATELIEQEVIKRTREAEEEQARLLSSIQSLDIGFLVIDESAQTILTNGAVEAILLADEKGANPIDNLEKLSSQPSVVRRAIVDCLAEARSSELKEVAIRGNYYQLSFSPVVLKTKPIGCVIVFRDVSEERKVERMKDEFISLTSHQLRTPLTAVNWITKRLLKAETGPLNPKQTEMLQDVQLSIDRLVVLVNDLLDISRIESGRIDINPVETDFKKLVESVVQELTSMFAEKGQQITMKIADTLPQVILDPKLVRQIILNLLSNSSKYTPEKGIITVGLSIQDSEVILQVSDSGIGIPLAQQKHIYERFFRADNVAQDGNEGTGLGMYMIKQIVELSQGRVWFESKEGKGTTFWVALPIKGIS